MQQNKQARMREHLRAWREKNPDRSIRFFLDLYKLSPSGRPAVGPQSERYVLERDGYRFVVAIVPDEDSSPADYDYLGKFTDNFDFPRTLKRRDLHDKQAPQCWEPGQGSDVRSLTASYNAAGMSRTDAYNAALEECYSTMARLESYYADQWSYVGVTVKAYAIDDVDGDKELAYASLWGLESDSHRAYFDETVLDLIAECLHSIRPASAPVETTAHP